MSNHKNRRRTTNKQVNRVVANDEKWTKLACEKIGDCRELIPAGYVAFLFTQMLDFLIKGKETKKFVERVGRDNLYVVFNVLMDSFLPTLYINTKEGKKEYEKMLEESESSGKA